MISWKIGEKAYRFVLLFFLFFQNSIANIGSYTTHLNNKYFFLLILVLNLLNVTEKFGKVRKKTLIVQVL